MVFLAVNPILIPFQLSAHRIDQLVEILPSLASRLTSCPRRPAQASRARCSNWAQSTQSTGPLSSETDLQVR